MSTPDTKLPDPWATAQAQLGMQRSLNAQTNALNRPDQITPYGSTTWDKNHRVQTQTLNPDVQAALTSQQQTQHSLADMGQNKIGQVQNAMSQPLDTSSMQPWQSTDFSSLGAMPQADQTTRQHVQDAMYGQFTTAMDPQYAQQDAQLRNRLAQQGITQGSDAYNTETGNFMRNKNLAYTQALNDAIVGGGNQMAQQFGMQMQGRQQGANEIMSSANANNTLRQNELSQAAYLRGLPLSDMNALFGFGSTQASQAPGFNQAPASIAPDYAGMVGQNYASQLAGQAAGNANTAQYFGAGLNALTSDTASKGFNWLGKTTGYW